MPDVSGRFLADFAPFDSAVTNSIIKLRDFETGSNKVGTALNHMADQFSGRKIIQEATLMAEAINKGGGTAKLTAAEIERVGQKANEAAEKMRLLGMAVPANLAILQTQVKEASNGFDQLGEHIAGTMTGMISAQAILGGVEEAWRGMTEFLKGSIEEAAAAEAAEKKLTVAMQDQGTATPELIAQYEAYGHELQKTTVYSHDAINATTALLVEVGNVGPRQMEKALKATTDLASGLGIDLTAATELVAKAFEGHTTALTKHGVVLDEQRVKAEGVTYVLDQLQKRFGGQAVHEVDTYAGSVKQLTNEWKDLQEAVGKKIITDPVLLTGLKLLTGGLKDASHGADDAGDSFSVMFTKVAFPSLTNVVRKYSEWAGTIHDVNVQLKELKPPSLLPDTSADEARINAIDARNKKFAEDTALAWEENQKTKAAAEAKEDRENDERAKKFEAQQAEFDKLVQQSTAIRLKTSTDTRAAEIENIEATELAQEAAMRKAGTLTDANQALMRENMRKTVDELGIDYKTIADSSMTARRQAAADALATYEAMLSSGDATREELDKQLQKYRDLAQAATAYGAAGKKAEDEITAASKRATDELEKQKKKDEELAAANDKLRRERSGSMDITAANFDQYTPPSDISKGALLALLKQGFSMENAIAILTAQKRGAAVDISKWPEDARGPRVPGFRTGVSGFGGGPAIVGEGGQAEVVNLPPGSSVTPVSAIPRSNGGAPSAGIILHTDVHVSGVFDPNSSAALGKVVSTALARNVLFTRILG